MVDLESDDAHDVGALPDWGGRTMAGGAATALTTDAERCCRAATPLAAFAVVLLLREAENDKGGRALLLDPLLAGLTA